MVICRPGSTGEITGGAEPEADREIFKEFKGIGDVGTDIFFREVQVA
jgi:hypothetical protein